MLCWRGLSFVQFTNHLYILDVRWSVGCVGRVVSDHSYARGKRPRYATVGAYLARYTEACSSRSKSWQCNV
jgi:hypothetical protein